MKVMLANPPWQINGRKGVRAGSRWPHLKLDIEQDYLPFPFFLAYATSLLKKNGFKTRAIDAIAEGTEYPEFYNRIKEFSPDLIFLETSTPSLEHDLNLIKNIKIYSDAKIALAGPDMDILNERFLETYDFIDYILKGEYEFTLLELCQNIKKKWSLAKIRGLIYKEGQKSIKNPPRPLLQSLESYPWPDRFDFPIYKYNDRPGGIPAPSAQMIATRGCPYLCSFCAWPQLVYNGRNYRTRQVKDVVDEMEYLVSKGFRSIYFDDDTFNIGKKRMLDLADELKKRNWKTPWAFMGRSDIVDEEILTKLREVGLSAVKYGVESGVQSLVDSVGKNLDLKIATKNMLLTKKLGIKMHLTFTFGLPGETKDTIKKTIDYALFINPESVQFSIMTPFPGTKFYEELKSKNMLASADFSDYDGNTKSVVKTDTLSPEDLTLSQKEAYDKWGWYRKQENRNKNMSYPEQFIKCLKENGANYTFKKSVEFIRDRKWVVAKKAEKKCDILLVNTPPWGVNSPPLTFGYLESYIENKGFKTDFLDLNIEWYHSQPKNSFMWDLNNKNYWMTKESADSIMSAYEKEIERAVSFIANHPAKIIGFSVSVGKHIITLELIKKIKKISDKKIIVGGRYYFEFPPTEKEHGLIDIIISGEGEIVITEVLKRLKENAPLVGIPGSCYYHGGKWINVPFKKMQSNLQEYPFPKYRNFNMNLYTSKVASSEWSRGCIAKCVFCVYPMPGVNYAYRDPSSIFEEMKYYHEIFDIKHVTLVDAAVNGNMKKLEETCDLLISGNLKVTWSAFAIPRKEMTLRILKKMKQAGCNRLEYGIETGSEKILKLMKKIPSVKIGEKVLRDTKKAGIASVIYIMVGFPGEDDKDFQMTLDYLTKNKDNIDLIRGLCAPYVAPGTYLYSHPEEYDIVFPGGVKADYKWETSQGDNYLIREEKARIAFKHCEDLGISCEGTVHTLNENKKMVLRQAL